MYSYLIWYKYSYALCSINQAVLLFTLPQLISVCFYLLESNHVYGCYYLKLIKTVKSQNKTMWKYNVRYYFYRDYITVDFVLICFVCLFCVGVWVCVSFVCLFVFFLLLCSFAFVFVFIRIPKGKKLSRK